ncbi:hypothetical protein HPB47_011202 [Ixodes persulcatus]|uniref:Uncharacterized protein n=1 Tax=Ixodes persulcatus TaxID=34615 RepID=A0AC60NWZ8_IXOPE|nr:hypothetical protein HPB47_011202 [Ixodes persulcatus]
MGQFVSKTWSDVHEGAEQSTPLPARRQSGVLTLSSLDPRSPTAEIQRTPIQLEGDWPDAVMQGAEAGDDPRSPTRLFQRTPIPMGKMLPDGEAEDSFGNTSEDLAARALPSQGNCAIPIEGKAKASLQKKVAKKRADTPGSVERTPLKNTSRPNTLLRSVQESRHQRQGKSDPQPGVKRGRSPAGKENGIVPA